MRTQSKSLGSDATVAMFNNRYNSDSQLFDLIPMQSEVGMVTSAPAVRRMRRFVPHAGLKMAVTASELSPMSDSSPGHGGGIHELNKRLTDMKMASNQDTVLRRESTFSNYWSMKSDHSRRNSQVCVYLYTNR